MLATALIAAEQLFSLICQVAPLASMHPKRVYPLTDILYRFSSYHRSVSPTHTHTHTLVTIRQGMVAIGSLSYKL